MSGQRTTVTMASKVLEAMHITLTALRSELECLQKEGQPLAVCQAARVRLQRVERHLLDASDALWMAMVDQEDADWAAKADAVAVGG